MIVHNWRIVICILLYTMKNRNKLENKVYFKELSQLYFQSTSRLVLSFYTDEKVIYMQTYDSEIAYQGNSK